MAQIMTFSCSTGCKSFRAAVLMSIAYCVTDRSLNITIATITAAAVFHSCMKPSELYPATCSNLYTELTEHCMLFCQLGKV